METPSPLKINSLLFLFAIILFACSKKKITPEPAKDPEFAKAEALYNKGSDSAFYYFNKVTSKQINHLEVAQSFSFMAMIQANKGDYFGSQESSMRALRLLKESDSTHWSSFGSCYNQLGLTCMELKRYSLAIAYFDKAIPFLKDRSHLMIALNNKALAYQKLNQYGQSIKIYSQILAQNTDRVQYARVLSNMAKTKWLENPRYNAAPQLLKALNIRREEKTDWGLNASYSHLADYYTPTKPDSALFYAENMYQVAQKLNSADDQIEALQKLIILSPSAAIKKYFEIYKRLNDSLQTSRNTAKNQFAIIRYESEKSKADNLLLQKDNTEKRYQIIKREVLLASGFLLFIATGIIALLWYKKRQQKMELDKQHAIQENQLKTSKKVHDVVANGLYRVMSEMENQPDIDRELIIDKIEDLYEKSRDISYEKPELNPKQFNEKISDLLSSFATPSTKVMIVGNKPILWENVNVHTRFELEHVLQELMVNMRKHSKADTVVVKFEQQRKNINISYTDNGVGMADDIILNNGLKNTVSRIDAISGKLTFETKLESGLKIHISFPVS